MQLHSQIYTVTKVASDVFPTVPRALLKAQNSEMAIDYHGELLKLQENDKVEVRLYSQKPDIDKSIYLMQGILHKLESGGFECSFGGLILIYKGTVDDNMNINMNIFVSLEKM